jgi:hypothetical protein
MTSVPIQLDPLRKGLLRVGFREDRLRTDFLIPNSQCRLPLLAFADQPFDSRTASVAVLDKPDANESDIISIRPLGAPLVFNCLPDHYQVWVQGRERPRFHSRLTPRQLNSFFEQYRNQLSPDAIYRAKVWGRVEREYQIDFVDAGFLPVIEAEAGQKLTGLIERVVSETKQRLGWKDVSEVDGRWLLQSTFWLLAAKILQDKSVRGFAGLDLAEVEDVFARLAKHYHSESPRPIPVGGQRRREALVAASHDIGRFGNCGAVSTEALAFLYESALIDRTTRIKLGTHSTPTWLVDYIVGKLRPWIEKDIAVGDRKVFEPACGHAGFLISAMRLLSELLPSDWRQPRKAYLRERLHGLELDPFALEVARLSLTLADVPNPNGWALTEANMFKGDLLQRGIRNATIVLGNPPFENFSAKERSDGWLPNKAAETFRRVVEHLPSGGVFGFVLPQTFLHAEQAADVRRILLRDYEISEISLFADKVFRYGEPESTVLIGRRLAQQATRRLPIRYQRVREWEVNKFSQTYEAGTVATVDAMRFSQTSTSSLLLPDLNDVWDALRAFPHFSEFAEIGQGFSHKGDADSALPKGTIKISSEERTGFVEGFAGWSEEQVTHKLPAKAWLNLSSRTILRPRWGTTTGKPQILLNYPRVSREAWRLKGLQDTKGHPVPSDFLVVRPNHASISLSVLWSILNSPVGNAYAYCQSNKRNVLAGDIRRMPVPNLLEQNLAALEAAVKNYFDIAAAFSQQKRGTRSKQKPGRKTAQMNFPLGVAEETDELKEAELKQLHWQIDAEVLRLYNLPAPLERKVLDLFEGVRRRGVPFEQIEYFPKGFNDLNRLSDLLAITADWPKTNRRRAKLIDLEEEGRLTPEQATELERLQHLADARVSLLKPRQTDTIDEQIEKLKRQGLWSE